MWRLALLDSKIVTSVHMDLQPSKVLLAAEDNGILCHAQSLLRRRLLVVDSNVVLKKQGSLTSSNHEKNNSVTLRESPKRQ
ncbi:BgTH12-01748 [Blumeria graminis f. sp. triticale]|uniref:BgTH12-01748 n=1 Tax=Blumeria graminis f. sp. triticale TaxID=1689686 RepID=A0A9W4CZS4_BLUGR|nr:BgTH12-01748 [Blumeria graminis f. sp. triticale]